MEESRCGQGVGGSRRVGGSGSGQQRESGQAKLFHPSLQLQAGCRAGKVQL